MNRLKKLYWIFTGLFIAFTVTTAVSQIIYAKNSVEIMNVLQFPLYMLTFLGIAKIAGLMAILIPGFQKIKEWAYAGFMFDYLGATYAMVAIGGTFDKWGFMIVPILLCGLSYYFNNKIDVRKATLNKVLP